MRQILLPLCRVKSSELDVSTPELGRIPNEASDAESFFQRALSVVPVSLCQRDLSSDLQAAHHVFPRSRKGRELQALCGSRVCSGVITTREGQVGKARQEMGRV